MKNSKGYGVVRLGDATSHGGKVMSARPDFKVLGKPVAANGDMTYCPQCKGVFPIEVNNSDRLHNGRAVAYDGNKASCGAILLSSI